jgi:hypothetical protein
LLHEGRSEFDREGFGERYYPKSDRLIGNAIRYNDAKIV